METTYQIIINGTASKTEKRNGHLSRDAPRNQPAGDKKSDHGALGSAALLCKEPSPLISYTAVPYITRTFGVKPPELEQWQTQYADSTDYLLGGSLVMKNGRIDKCYFDGGYARAMSTGSTTDRFVFYYYNRDHLGNNREVVDQKARSHQVTSYYPFGAPYADPAAVSGAEHQPYKYNGKELDTMHGLNTYDYGARQYDPILARWDRVDPLAEKYYSISPYVYCHDNPIMRIDIDGLYDFEGLNNWSNPVIAVFPMKEKYNTISVKR